MSTCQSCDYAFPRGGLVEGQCRQCRDEWTIAALITENDRLLRTNGRRERHILRARLQEAGSPVTPEWLGDVERIWPEARVTQRLCSALRRAWDERDKARAIIATAPHHDGCEVKIAPRFSEIPGPCDCWKSRADA